MRITATNLIFFVLGFFLSDSLQAQAGPPAPEDTGVGLIRPIVESPPLNANEARALSQFGSFRNWGISELGFDTITDFTGDSVKVCICDTGRPLPHPALDSFFLSSANFSPDPYDDDNNGHSTHVAGIISEVAPGVKLLYAKVLADGGFGSTRGVADGVRWCIDSGADVINMSLGSPSPDPSLKAAIDKAEDLGVIVVAAAGNDGQAEGENRIGWPARYESVIAVGSVNYEGKVSFFSSSGKEGDVLAPGERIVSTWKDGGYISLSGTSMASPFVAGITALRIEQQRAEGKTRKEIAESSEPRLEETALDYLPEGFDEVGFWGTVTPRLYDTLVVDPEPPAGPSLPNKPVPLWIVALIVLAVVGAFSLNSLISKKSNS